MPSKSAGKWLNQDRCNNPTIPFFRSQGQTYYREAEVVAFIRRVLNPSARFIRVNDQLFPERRRAADRRKLALRRKKIGAVLQATIERRRPGQTDRRQASESNRRGQASQQQSALA